MSEPIRFYLFDRADGPEWNDRVKRAYAWAYARALPIEDERIAYPPEDAEPRPRVLREITGLCVTDGAGLLVWNLVSIGPAETIAWCVRRLAPLPLVVACDNRTAHDIDGALTFHTTRWPVVRWAQL